MSDEEECNTFEGLVESLKLWADEWKNNDVCPDCIISALGAVASELIWSSHETNKEARDDAKDFCQRVRAHVNVLAKNQPDYTDGRPQ